MRVSLFFRCSQLEAFLVYWSQQISSGLWMREQREPFNFVRIKIATSQTPAHGMQFAQSMIMNKQKKNAVENVLVTLYLFCGYSLSVFFFLAVCKRELIVNTSSRAFIRIQRKHQSPNRIISFSSCFYLIYRIVGVMFHT